MEKRLQIVLAVIRAIIACCTRPQWTDLINSIPAFALALEKLEAKETAINKIIAQQSEDIKGFTEQRQTLRLALAMISFTYLRRGMAFAKSVGNTPLYKSLNISLSKLKRMDFNIIGQVMQQCYDNMSAIAPEQLAPFGITSFTSWQNAITAYTRYASTPRSKSNGKKALGKMLVELMKEANTFMRTEIVPQGEAFIQANPLFYNDFKAALRAVPIAVHHTRLNALVTTEDSMPCFNCKVTVDAFTKDGKSFKEAWAITEIDGTCLVSAFEDGNRTITVTGPAIVSKTFGPFKFENGKAVNKVLVCVPAFENLPAEIAKPAKHAAGK